MSIEIGQICKRKVLEIQQLCIGTTMCVCVCVRTRAPHRLYSILVHSFHSQTLEKSILNDSSLRCPE